MGKEKPDLVYRTLDMLSLKARSNRIIGWLGEAKLIVATWDGNR